jgi:NAD(P)-dependent dehydrogenase (short-subunit alcohol dehydrogenase family)
VNILILGASSYIGQALARAFSLGNCIYLHGRNENRLKVVASDCCECGAVEVELHAGDFVTAPGGVFGAFRGRNIDLIIDAASSSSQVRDSAIAAADVARCIQADFTAHVAILSDCVLYRGMVPDVIFISTVLTLVQSPDRVLYSSLKRIYEVFLKRLCSEKVGMKLLIVHVGSVIPTDQVSLKARHLGERVFRAYGDDRKRVVIGLSGFLYVLLFNIQPLIFCGVTVIQRGLRRFLRR